MPKYLAYKDEDILYFPSSKKLIKRVLQNKMDKFWQYYVIGKEWTSETHNDVASDELSLVAKNVTACRVVYVETDEAAAMLHISSDRTEDFMRFSHLERKEFQRKDLVIKIIQQTVDDTNRYKESFIDLTKDLIPYAVNRLHATAVTLSLINIHADDAPDDLMFDISIALSQKTIVLNNIGLGEEFVDIEQNATCSKDLVNPQMFSILIKTLRLVGISDWPRIAFAPLEFAQQTAQTRNSRFLLNSHHAASELDANLGVATRLFGYFDEKLDPFDDLDRVKKLFPQQEPYIKRAVSMDYKRFLNSTKNLERLVKWLPESQTAIFTTIIENKNILARCISSPREVGLLIKVFPEHRRLIRLVSLDNIEALLTSVEDLKQVMELFPEHRNLICLELVTNKQIASNLIKFSEDITSLTQIFPEQASMIRRHFSGYFDKESSIEALAETTARNEDSTFIARRLHNIDHRGQISSNVSSLFARNTARPNEHRLKRKNKPEQQSSSVTKAFTS